MPEKDKDNLGVDTNQGTPQTPDQDNSQDKEELTKERWKQQLEGSKQEAERLKALLVETEKEKASKDAKSLLELHEKDPKLASEVAQQFGYDSFDDAKKFIEDNTSKGVKTKEEKVENDFDKLYEARRAKERHEEALEKASKSLSEIKDEDIRKQAEERFNFLIEGRQLTEQTALEFAEMATLYVSKDKRKGEKYSEGLANLASIGMGSSKSQAEEDESSQYVVRDGELVLKSNKQS